MATPQMLVASVSLTTVPYGGAVARINTKNPDGTALDVSSGYTLDQVQAAPATQANLEYGPGPEMISSGLSASFDATGFNLTVDGNTVAGLMRTTSMLFRLYISNDSGSTRSLAGLLTLTLNLVQGAL